jgi:flagellar hook assembly protein FlgD/outer membrane protein OmpA-like peptidoglycan-associated protein
MRRNRISVLICLGLCIQVLAFGQYAPIDGAEDFTDLFSPVLLAEGAPVSFGEGPQTDVLNPATSGLVQRTTLDASYVALTGFGDSALGAGWQGHVVNLGIVSPTRAAVFSGSFHVVSSALVGMPIGTSAWLHASAAKELYPGWLVGAGLRFGGGNGDTFDVGAAIDLGMLRLAGTLGPFEDFTWGFALQNFGKWYKPVAASGPLPSAFTPAGGLSFTAYRNEWLQVQTSGSLSAPGFQNLRAGLTGRVTLFDVVSLHAGWKVDLRQIIDPAIATRSFIPSFGISANFRTGLGEEGFAADRGWTETELKTQAGAAPLYNDVWAIGAGVNAPLGIIDRIGPEVEITYPKTENISPNNDGTSDALTVPLTIQDERFVMSWRFEVIDSDGAVVRTIRNKDDRPENAGFQSIVDRLLDVRTGIQIPESIRWNGVTDDGEIAPDGEYTFRVVAEDDNGNLGVSDVPSVVVDSTPPEITILAVADRDRIFSPNGDGNKDVFTIGQTGTSETLWRAEIVNSLGTSVRSFTWADSPPRDVQWDGRSENGEALPDGVYRYRVSSVDAAGNSARGEIANIIMNTEVTPVSVAIGSSFFSPNGDGSMDTVTLRPSVPITVGISDWELVVTDAQGRSVRRYGDTQVAPSPVVFEGLSDSQTLVNEGSYHAVLTVRYVNGNAPSAASPEFVVDLTHPVVAVQSDNALISPNGDGKLDTVTFFQETSREERWIGTVSNESGAVVRQVVWPTLADQQVTWNGRQDDGRLAGDGTYFYVLESTDRAGNRVSSTPIQIVVDTSDAEIGVRAEFEAFSPNADNVRDRQRLFVRVDREGDVASYDVTVLDTSGGTVRRFEGRNAVQPSVTWDGTQANGRRAPDGLYQARLTVRFANGIEISAGTGEFVVDTAEPSVTVTVPYLLFSPDGDGERETIRIVQASSVEEAWTGSIRDESGGLIREYFWAGTVVPIEWDGTDTAGNTAADGTYHYQVSATDRAGNSKTGGVSDIVVDTREPRLFVTSSTSAFSPDDDGVRDDLSFDMYANLLDGATGWRLTIKTAAGLVVKEYSGTDVVDSRTIDWDGRDGRGQLREGLFTAEFAIEYEKGNRPVASTGQFRVDVSDPIVRLSLEPVPFSPDNDDVDDDLEISIDVADQSPIRAWRLEIFDRNNRFFNEFSGLGMPAARLIWDGRAADGELVISAEDYPYRFTVSDELGNTTVQEGVIPVDILVIRDGDRLKVQISSITFAPNSPQLIIDPADERGAKNRAILLRLAEIFEKYASYSIRIEGHAVNISGTETEERTELAPLSLSRAQSVKDAMVELGISERRVSVVGLGGTEPLVPHDDLDNRWKNRRVEFVLIR